MRWLWLPMPQMAEREITDRHGNVTHRETLRQWSAYSIFSEEEQQAIREQHASHDPGPIGTVPAIGPDDYGPEPPEELRNGRDPRYL